jgi:DDE family transposase
VRNTTGHYGKTNFALDFATRQLTCPAGGDHHLRTGKTVHFPQYTCAAGELRQRCTSSPPGRSVSIHPSEALLAELRQRQQTPTGRAQPRERTRVEHALAHVGHWQAAVPAAAATRKNLSGLRRAAVVHNLHVIARQESACQPAA